MAKDVEMTTVFRIILVNLSLNYPTIVHAIVIKLQFYRLNIDSNDSMHDDYLNRNADVVKKAIRDDPLEKSVLKNLLKIESSNKKRKPIIKAINFKLKSL